MLAKPSTAMSKSRELVCQRKCVVTRPVMGHHAQGDECESDAAQLATQIRPSLHGADRSHRHRQNPPPDAGQYGPEHCMGESSFYHPTGSQIGLEVGRARVFGAGTSGLRRRTFGLGSHCPNGQRAQDFLTNGLGVA
jgi:hypothetical protein